MSTRRSSIDEQNEEITAAVAEEKKKTSQRRSRGVRKPYAKRACIPCKKAHAGCDNTKPCRRCVSLGIEDQCIVAERKKSTTPRKPRTRRKTVSTAAAKAKEAVAKKAAESSSGDGDSSAADVFKSSGIGAGDMAEKMDDESLKKRRKSAGGEEDLAQTLHTILTDPSQTSVDMNSTVSGLPRLTQGAQDSGIFDVHESDLNSLSSAMPDIDTLLREEPSREETHSQLDSSFSTLASSTLPPPFPLGGVVSSSAENDTASANAEDALNSMISPRKRSRSAANLHAGSPDVFGDMLSQYVDQQQQQQRRPSGPLSGSDSIAMLPFLIKGLADVAQTTTDPKMLQQIQKHRQTLIQMIPGFVESSGGMTPDEKEALTKKLQWKVARDTMPPAVPRSSRADDSRSFQSIHYFPTEQPQSQQQQQNLVQHHGQHIHFHPTAEQNFQTHVADQFYDMLHSPHDDLTTATPSQNAGAIDGTYADAIANLWASMPDLANMAPSASQPIPHGNTISFAEEDQAMASPPLTPTSLLNLDMFDIPSKQSDIKSATSVSSTAGPKEEIAAQIQHLMERLLAMKTSDSSSDGTVTASRDTRQHPLFGIDPANEHKSTVTFTDLDDEDGTDDSIVDLVTKSASELQNDDIISLLNEDDTTEQQQQQQHLIQQGLHKTPYWVNHGGEDEEELLFGMDNDQGDSTSTALVSYVGGSSSDRGRGHAGTRTAISGDMRMRSMDQQSGMEAIKRLLGKKTAKEIVRELVLQNRALQMLKLTQDEDRRTIEQQRHEIERLKKRQDEMLDMIQELQRLMISSGIMSPTARGGYK